MSSLVSNIARTVAGVADSKKENAKVWINVGFEHPTAKDSNGNPLRCTLPLGIPLDTIKDGTYSNSANENVVTAVECGNELKRVLLAMSNEMAAGECRDISNGGIKVFLQKTREPVCNDKEIAVNAQSIVASLFG